eukprot:scaffold21470_cov90-Isochrysis_galbana.AAC.2
MKGKYRKQAAGHEVGEGSRFESNGYSRLGGAGHVRQQRQSTAPRQQAHLRAGIPCRLAAAAALGTDAHPSLQQRQGRHGLPHARLRRSSEPARRVRAVTPAKGVPQRHGLVGVLALLGAGRAARRAVWGFPLRTHRDSLQTL